MRKKAGLNVTTEDISLYNQSSERVEWEMRGPKIFLERE